jgi:hypothetical protein
MLDFLTAALVLITAVYCFITYKILRANEAAVAAMREQSEALVRPYIAVAPYVPPKGWIFFLRIQNVGKTAARNLRLEIDRDFFRFGQVNENDNLRNFNAFKFPAASFPPGSDLLFHLATGPDLFGENADDAVTPATFNVTASYEALGRIVTETTYVDLRPYAESSPPPDSLIDKLDEIKKAIQG